MPFEHPAALLLLPVVLALWLLARRRSRAPQRLAVSSLRFWSVAGGVAAPSRTASPSLQDAWRALGLALLALALAQPSLRSPRPATLHLLVDRSARMASRIQEGPSVWQRAGTIAGRWIEEARHEGRQVRVHLEPPVGVLPAGANDESLEGVAVAAREGDLAPRAGALAAALEPGDELRVLTLGRRGPGGEPVGVVPLDALVPFDVALLRLDPRPRGGGPAFDPAGPTPPPPGGEPSRDAGAAPWWILIRAQGPVPFPVVLVAGDAQGEVARITISAGQPGEQRWVPLEPTREPVAFLSVRREGPPDRCAIDDRLVRALQHLPAPRVRLDALVPTSVERALHLAGAEILREPGVGEGGRAVVDLEVRETLMAPGDPVLPRRSGGEAPGRGGAPVPEVWIVKAGGDRGERGAAEELTRVSATGFPRDVAFGGAALGGASVVLPPPGEPPGWSPILRARITSSDASGRGAPGAPRRAVPVVWASASEIRVLFDPRGTPWEEHPSYPLFWARVLEWAMGGRAFTRADGAEVGRVLALPRWLRGARFARVEEAGEDAADPREERFLASEAPARGAPRWIPARAGLHRLVAPRSLVSRGSGGNPQEEAWIGVRPSILVSSDPELWAEPTLPVGERTLGPGARREEEAFSLSLPLGVMAAVLLAFAILAASP